ncbi:hypothetical protein G6F43_013893 [Rhizopus delemar]|nr:hypothetical protein G6F43_013893 [Rhizopus delemar]
MVVFLRCYCTTRRATGLQRRKNYLAHRQGWLRCDSGPDTARIYNLYTTVDAFDDSAPNNDMYEAAVV